MPWHSDTRKRELLEYSVPHLGPCGLTLLSSLRPEQESHPSNTLGLLWWIWEKLVLFLWFLSARVGVQFSRSVVSDSLRPHGLQHTRPPCPSPTPRAYSNSCPSSQWCLPTISSSVIPFSSCLQSFPASGSFQMSQFFISGGQSIRVSASASVPPVNIQDLFPLGWTG